MLGKAGSAVGGGDPQVTPDRRIRGLQGIRICQPHMTGLHMAPFRYTLQAGVQS